MIYGYISVGCIYIVGQNSQFGFLFFGKINIISFHKIDFIIMVSIYDLRLSWPLYKIPLFKLFSHFDIIFLDYPRVSGPKSS